MPRLFEKQLRQSFQGRGIAEQRVGLLLPMVSDTAMFTLSVDTYLLHRVR